MTNSFALFKRRWNRTQGSTLCQWRYDTLPFAALIIATPSDNSYSRPSCGNYAEYRSVPRVANKATLPLEAALVVGNPRFSEPELRLPDLPEAETEAREIAAFIAVRRSLRERRLPKTTFLALKSGT